MKREIIKEIWVSSRSDLKQFFLVKLTLNPFITLGWNKKEIKKKRVSSKSDGNHRGIRVSFHKQQLLMVIS